MIYIVTGHPRSGTSMIMACLEAGGMAVVKSAKRDKFIDKTGDAFYRMNRSLYELDNLSGATFPREYDGQAVKVVMPWVRRIAAGAYRVIVMIRDLDEIAQSAEAAYGCKETVAAIKEMIKESVAVLKERRDVFTLDFVAYSDMLNTPEDTLTKLDWPIDVRVAATAVDPGQHRFRREKLYRPATHVGIIP